MRRSRGLVGRALVALLVVALIGACGDDDDDENGSGTGEGATATSAPPTGEPIVIMTVSDATQPTGNTSPEFAGAVEARAKFVNEHGGINGRPLEVIGCDAKVDPNATLQCARQAIEQDAVALVGVLVNLEDQLFPLMEENGIAMIGVMPGGPVSYASPVSFPITPGLLGYFTALPGLLAENGATKVGMLMTDFGPATAAAFQLTETGAGIAGIDFTDATAIPVDQTDLGPLVTGAIDGGEDGMATWMPGDPYLALLRQLESSGYDGLNATVMSATDEERLASAGSASEGLFAVGSFSPPGADNPASEMMRADMEAFDASLSINEVSQNHWASTWLFERVAQDLESVDRASVLRAMGELDDFDMGGMSPPLTTTEAFADFPPGYPPGFPAPTRIFNPAVSFMKLENGRLVAASDEFLFFNPFTSEPVEAP